MALRRDARLRRGHAGEHRRGSRQRRLEIIEGKGATNLAIGLSTARIIEAVLGDQNRVLPISSVQNGVYELTDVALSLPTLVSRAGAGEVLQVPLAVKELLGLQGSANTLRQARDSLGL